MSVGTRSSCVPAGVYPDVRGAPPAARVWAPGASRSNGASAAAPDASRAAGTGRCKASGSSVVGAGAGGFGAPRAAAAASATGSRARPTPASGGRRSGRSSTSTMTPASSSSMCRSLWGSGTQASQWTRQWNLSSPLGFRNAAIEPFVLVTNTPSSSPSRRRSKFAAGRGKLLPSGPRATPRPNTQLQRGCDKRPSGMGATTGTLEMPTRVAARCLRSTSALCTPRQK
mmetsp:Transcript_86137/g.257049  ORF Transcript_86137/g.257049 Transcript_86137/m.257049 type:complete len:228 (-) Transcript_86137:837-1520(-)